MTLYLILGAFGGGLATLLGLALIQAARDVGSRLMTPRPGPDEHRDLTRHFELRDGEVPV